MASRLLALFLGSLALAPAAPALELDREYGSSSFKFLKLPLSPRIVGLAGAGSALVDGAGDMDLNPAAPMGDSGRLVVGKGMPFSEFEAGSSHISWSVPYEGYRILLNARYLGFEKIPGYDDIARPTTPYGAHTLKGQIGLAGMVGPYAYGATVNFAENNVASANYRTAMVNVGVQFPVWRGLRAGASVVNADFWGSEARIEGNEDPFPPTAAQAGIAYSHDFSRGIRASLAADARTRNDEKMCFPVGAEVSWQKFITVRGGFPIAEQEPGIAAGVGLAWAPFAFQYAYQGHETLGPGHFWTLEIRY